MKDKLSKWFLITLGTVSWSLTMIKSGWTYSYGLGFWGANGHDGIWHIALAESLARGTFAMPVFAGSLLQNYHIGFDLILAILTKVTSIPTINLYFQILPPILALLVGILTYLFTDLFSGSKKAAWWATFFVYFGGSFGWVLGKGESAFWSQQAISSLINPPFALSLVFILAGLILLIRLERKITVSNLLFSILIFGSLIEIKAYAGLLSLGALLVSGLYSQLFYKKTFLLKVFAGSLILSLILYLPLNRNSAGLLVFQPFWFLETMMGLTDRLNWARFYSALLAYRSGNNVIKAVPAYLVAFAIFWVGNMSTRIIKEAEIFKWFKNIKKLNWIQVFISSIIIAGGLIPILFLQKGTPWNTIQFFYYSLFFSSLLAGTVVSSFIENSKLSTSILYSIEVAVILLTIPTTILTLRDVYIPGRPPAMLTKDEISATTFLSRQPQGIVLTKPFDSSESAASESNPPRPLYLYTSTAYVSAFSKHQTFFEDEINLDITGYNWQPRREEVLAWYSGKNDTTKRQFLVDNNIKYIYWIKKPNPSLDPGKLGLASIFENNSIIIYQVE